MPDSIKPSRLLRRLEAEIAASSTALDADCKRAERAICWARQGRLDDARRELDQLRERYADAPNVRMSSWLNLVHGIADHCSNMDPSARDKVLRAHALSSAADLVSLRARSAAWLSHMDYLDASIPTMICHALESLELADRDDHSTRSRATLVIGQAYHLAGRPNLARSWYRQAHIHATAEGDELTLSALMHNKAWLCAQELRIGAWLDAEIGRDEGYALLGAESVANFDLMIGAKSLSTLVPLLRAQIHAARGEYERALPLYEGSLPQAFNQGMARLRSDLVADQAWCRIQLGQTGRAYEEALTAEECIDPNGYFDDRIMAHGRLAQVFAATGHAESALRHKRLALDALASHRMWQQQVLTLLENESAALAASGL